MVEELFSEKIQRGEDLVVKLCPLIGNVYGVMKLQDKIRQEIAAMKKWQTSNDKVKMAQQLSSSQMGHLESLVECVLRPGVTAVYKEFPKIVVDVVSEEGRVWTKVVTRNPKYQSYGMILEQAKKYLKAALMNLCMDEPPKVVFEFTRAVDDGLANKLKALGVTVEGDIYTETSSESSYYYNSDDSDYWCPSD